MRRALVGRPITNGGICDFRSLFRSVESDAGEDEGDGILSADFKKSELSDNN